MHFRPQSRGSRCKIRGSGKVEIHKKTNVTRWAKPDDVLDMLPVFVVACGKHLLPRAPCAAIAPRFTAVASARRYTEEGTNAAAIISLLRERVNR